MIVIIMYMIIYTIVVIMSMTSLVRESAERTEERLGFVPYVHDCYYDEHDYYYMATAKQAALGTR